MAIAPLEKIISGGRKGADRAALDWAINNGVPLRSGSNRRERDRD
jgi:hypothetical protein